MRRRLLPFVLAIACLVAPSPLVAASGTGSTHTSSSKGSSTKAPTTHHTASPTKTKAPKSTTPKTKAAKTTTPKTKAPKTTGSKSTATHATTSKKSQAEVVGRDSKGRIARSEEQKRVFEKQTGYPHGRPGYVVDHVKPLACGGLDVPSNMQWQTVAAAAAKDKIERKGCR